MRAVLCWLSKVTRKHNVGSKGSWWRRRQAGRRRRGGTVSTADSCTLRSLTRTRGSIPRSFLSPCRRRSGSTLTSKPSTVQPPHGFFLTFLFCCEKKALIRSFLSLSLSLFFFLVDRVVVLGHRAMYCTKSPDTECNNESLSIRYGGIFPGVPAEAGLERIMLQYGSFRCSCSSAFFLLKARADLHITDIRG